MMKSFLTIALILSIGACGFFPKEEPVNYVVMHPTQAAYVNHGQALMTMHEAKEKAQAKRTVVVREKGPHYVIYEYKDVRLDEIANIAEQYCHEQGKRAYLRESLTHRNNNRISTFDCVLYQ